MFVKLHSKEPIGSEELWLSLASKTEDPGKTVGAARALAGRGGRAQDGRAVGWRRRLTAGRGKRGVARGRQEREALAGSDDAIRGGVADAKGRSLRAEAVAKGMRRTEGAGAGMGPQAPKVDGGGTKVRIGSGSGQHGAHCSEYCKGRAVGRPRDGRGRVSGTGRGKRAAPA